LLSPSDFCALRIHRNNNCEYFARPSIGPNLAQHNPIALTQMPMPQFCGKPWTFSEDSGIIPAMESGSSGCRGHAPLARFDDTK